MSDKTASELLLESAAPFDNACLKVRELEKDFERCLGYLHYLGIDPMDGSPIAEDIVAMRIQELKKAKRETDAAMKELFELKQVIAEVINSHGESKIEGLNVKFIPMDGVVEIECRKHILIRTAYPHFTGNLFLYKCHICNHVQGSIE